MLRVELKKIYTKRAITGDEVVLFVTSFLLSDFVLYSLYLSFCFASEVCYSTLLISLFISLASFLQFRGGNLVHMRLVIVTLFIIGWFLHILYIAF